MTQDIPEWDWDPTYFDWISAERWMDTNSVRALVEWYQQENPENHLIIEALDVAAAAPLANEGAAKATHEDHYAVFSNNWRGRRNVLEEILGD